jgi:hypothetical protein
MSEDRELVKAYRKPRLLNWESATGKMGADLGSARPIEGRVFRLPRSFVDSTSERP